MVGDVYVDYALNPRVVRLGGVLHAARALGSLGVPYAIAYAAPAYLDGDILRFAKQLGAASCVRVGVINGGPSVILAGDARESGNQEYDEVLRESKHVEWEPKELKNLLDGLDPTDVLLIPGILPLNEVLGIVGSRSVRTHVDVQYNVNLDMLWASGASIDTIFVSTSTEFLQRDAGGDPRRLRTEVFGQARSVVLKENRGGSRVFLEDGRVAEAPAYPVRTQHSMGVGDCFNCVWLATNLAYTAPEALALASYAASLYAGTWDHTQFTASLTAMFATQSEVMGLAGVRSRWEERPGQLVYIAAPDFPDVETSSLDRLSSALKYHNFSARRPIAENGLYSEKMSAAEATEMYNADVGLIESASLVIAVPLFSDPGTFAELGFAKALGKPTVLWNARRIAPNLFAWLTADRRCAELHEVIDVAFSLLGKVTVANWIRT